MRWSLLAGGLVSSLLIVLAAASAGAQAPQASRVSGPIVHENLAVYFMDGHMA
jgi:hypothetical protein